ncbi:Z1 domain-containing protein [Citrifermentans bremense]|uniref:Z1 domain-containing protein n=1 Tax=Citrifermentans bremense TaxID=60035 RepID=UPI000418F6E7|nr:Z1 domain-containing protein [Citrifermentans bremense]
MFYSQLRDSRRDDDELAACIERVVNQLEDTATTGDRPGMLLGKIQSGKTRAFVGVIARAFDRGFDISVVLTKGTKTLSAQTVARLNNDFQTLIEDDHFLVFDIMKQPGRLTRSELQRKLVIVAKKQVDNLRRLTEFFREDYPDLKNRKVLLVDDEADLASVRFVRTKGSVDVEQGKIAEQMDDLRRLVNNIAFLQVTATPYSLYLQPEGYETGYVFKPKRPAFTELLPIHGGYVGGDDYFIGRDLEDPRAYLVSEVTRDEQNALRRPDQRRIHPDRVLTSPNTRGLVRAIITFVLGVVIRRWQQAEAGERKRKYAMIIHNDTQKAAHAWQNQVIEWVFAAINSAAVNQPDTLNPLFDAAFADLSASIEADRGRLPCKSEAFESFIEALEADDVVKETVNSDKDVLALLDDKAELKLRTPFNIFVGGSILDRGITIPNLLTFYYGRNPQTMQADTVLQHSRMYGNRDRRDLAVTRFYTSRDVYDRLYSINEFENALREAFASGANEQGVVFIQADSNHRVRPCAPNKVLLSNVVAVRPSGLYLPTGFQTISGRNMKAAQTRLNDLVPSAALDAKAFIEIERQTALDIIDVITGTLVFPDAEFEWDAMRGLLDYYSDVRDGGDGKVLLLAETGRKLSRERSGDKSGLSILGGGEIRRLVQDPNRSKPALILLQQEGTAALGWSGYKFWWPILAAPGTVEPCIFATKVATD